MTIETMDDKPGAVEAEAPDTLVAGRKDVSEATEEHGPVPRVPLTAEKLFRLAIVVSIACIVLAMGVALTAPGAASLTGLILFAGIASVAGAGLYALTRPRDRVVPGFTYEEHVDTDLSELFDSLSDPVVAVTSGGAVQFANSAYRKFLHRFEVDVYAQSGPLEAPRLAFAGHPVFAPVIFRMISRADLNNETVLVAPSPGAQPHRIRVEEKVVSGRSDGLRLWIFRDEGALPVEPPKPTPEEQFVWADVLGLARFLLTPDGRITSTYGNLAELVGAPIAPASSVQSFLPQLDLARLMRPPEVAGQVWGEPEATLLRTVEGAEIPVTVVAYHRAGAEKAVQIIVSPNGQPAPSTAPDNAEAEAAAALDAAAAAREIPGSPAALFPRLFAEAPLGVALLGADKRLVASNPAFARLLGCDLKAGMLLRELVGPDYAESTQRLVDLAASGKAPAGSVEVVLASTDEEEQKRSARLYATRVGKGGSALLFVVDSSEQRWLEEQVSESQKMQAVGQLAGGIAHDFNNLLTAISGYCDLLLQSHPVGDPSFSDLSQIRQTASRAANLVRQLLAFSRQQTMRPTVLWLNDMVADLKVFLGRVVTERIRLQVKLGRDLWPIHADQGQLERVIMNLAVNARDAMPDGGKLIIRTSNLPAEQALEVSNLDLGDRDYVLIEVSDNGEGIPKENQSKIFEPFFTTKALGEGTGLGLSTAYGIVNQSGGHLTVESQMGEGTTFRIYLPRDVHASARPQAPGHQDLASRMQDLTGKGTILLVEDEDAVRAFASRALKARGYEVLEADCGEAALELMRERGRSVDLVVSDVVMPGIDGPTLTRQLKDEFGPVKVILISGYAEDAIRKNLETEQDVEFLPKPFSLKELAQTVKTVLSAGETPPTALN